MSLTDLRWRLAFAVASPACWLDEWIEGRTAPPWDATWTGDGPRPEARVLYYISPVPLRYRVLRWLAVDPLVWLSDRIYPGWHGDERALLDYWGGR